MLDNLHPGEQLLRRELHECYGGRQQGGIGPSRKTPVILFFTDPAAGHRTATTTVGTTTGEAHESGSTTVRQVVVFRLRPLNAIPVDLPVSRADGPRIDTVPVRSNTPSGPSSHPTASRTRSSGARPPSSTSIASTCVVRATRSGGFGSAVAAAVPDGFPAYVRILHPARGPDGRLVGPFQGNLQLWSH